MTTPVIDIPEPAATPAKKETHPSQKASVDRASNKADVERAKRKKKRDAHRVALRRSHTNG